LHVKGRITLATRDGQEVYALAKDGALTGLSIGWKGARGTQDGSTRLIAEADLIEGSLVPCPMNDRTRITAVKSIRDLEDMLREAGFSGRRSKHAASAAWKALEATESDEAELAELAAMVGSSTARLLNIGRN
jgi:phage head maturation protease